MKNPIRNAWYLIWHKPRKFLFALLTRVPWIMPNDEIYLKWFYYLSTGKHLNLQQPTTYNEKLQWLKLYDRNPRYVTMADKYAVKEYVAKQIGEEYVIPTIGKWDNPSDIEWDKLPNQFVLKTNHDGGGNGVVICKDSKDFDYKRAVTKMQKSMRRDVYKIGREWPYKTIKKCVLAEPYMEDSATKELRDYKFFCFDGVVKALFVATERQSKEGVCFDFFDEQFNHLDITQEYSHYKGVINKPESFELMKSLAAKLSKGIPHVRIDFYEVDGHPYFGEFTFYHWSGYGPFVPVEWETIFGDWIKLPIK